MKYTHVTQEDPCSPGEEGLTPEEIDVAEYIWDTIGDTSYLDPRTYFELCLTIADLTEGRGGSPKASTIYDRLSPTSSSQVTTYKGKLSKLLKTGHLPQQHSILTGGRKRTQGGKVRGGIVWKIGPELRKLHQATTRCEAGAQATTEAMRRYTTTGDATALRRLRHTARTIGNKNDAVGTNGCDSRSSTHLRNRRSEPCDRKNGGGSESRTPPNLKTVGYRSQRRFLDERVRSQAERLMFLHILKTSRRSRYSVTGPDEQEWIVIGCEMIERVFGGPRRTKVVWQDSELIEVFSDGAYLPPGVNDGKGKARMFRIYDDVYTEYAALCDEGQSRRYRLDTPGVRRTSEPRPKSCSMSDKNGHALPPLVKEAMEVLSATSRHRVKIEPIDEAIKSLAAMGSREARHQLAHLRLAKDTILQQAVSEDDGVLTLQNAYEMQPWGRVSFKLGGPQGIQRGVKQRMYDFPELTNYDVRSCHTAALRQTCDILSDHGIEIDTSPLDAFEGKYEVAERTGLPVSLVKITSHAVKYGGWIPHSIAQARQTENETGFFPKLAAAAEELVDDPDAALKILHEEFNAIREMVIEIAEALTGPYYKAVQKGGYMKNAVGISLRPADYEEGHERRSKAMSWMLQGLESAFVHSITILSSDHDYEVVANEHDGVLVDGEIPEAAIEEAREMSGFTRAEIVEKPFADEDDVQAVYGENVDSDDNTAVLALEKMREDRSTVPSAHVSDRTSSSSSPLSSSVVADDNRSTHRSDGASPAPRRDFSG